MKLKLSVLVGSVEGLKALLDCKLPIKTSYWINKLVTGQVEKELKFYDDARNKLVKELGTENEDQSVSVKDDKLKDFTEKLSEVLNQEVEVEWEPIDIDSLGDIKLEPKHIVPFIFK